MTLGGQGARVLAATDDVIEWEEEVGRGDQVEQEAPWLYISLNICSGKLRGPSLE